MKFLLITLKINYVFYEVLYVEC